MNTKITLLSLKEAEKLNLDFCNLHFPLRAAGAERFVRPEDKWRCLGAGALLYGVLGISEKDLSYTEQKKPFVKDSAFHFNLSHSGNYILLATDDQEVGADIEVLNPAHLGLAKEVLLPEEQAWMQEDPLPRFFILWTLKESVMKQQGLGFALSPKSFSVLPLAQGAPIQINGQTLYAKTIAPDHHCLSVCALHPIESLSPEFFKAKDFN